MRVATAWGLVSVLVAACRGPVRPEEGRVEAAPGAVVSAAPSALAARASEVGSAPEARHAQVAEWHHALLPDCSLWLEGLVTSPFPTWPHLQPPLETDRIAFTIGKPSFREARVSTRSCRGSGPCLALVLPIKVHTVRGPALSLAVAREVHGGPFPWTPLHGCSRRLDGPDALSAPWTCGPLYLAEDAGHEAAPLAALPPLQVTTDDSPDLPLRLDWRGTGSLETVPVIANTPGAYAAQIFVLFEEQNKHWVSGSKVFEIRLD